MKLIVKNFGPLRDVEINSNKLVLLIGPQASGKSVLAKLLAIFNDSDFLYETAFENQLLKYNIDFLELDTYIEFQYNFLYIKFQNGRIDSNFSHKELSITPVYIPTERSFISSISEFLFNFLKSKIPLPECVVDFGAQFETARKQDLRYKLPFIDNIEYFLEDGKDKLQINTSKTINFTQSSSGLQAVIPMAMIIEMHSNSSNKYFIIEEPELNLYPVTQKRLVEFLSAKCLKNNNSLVITTHSPYILTSFANLIQAFNTAMARPEAKDEVKKIIHEEAWIDFSKVSAYYISDGTAKDMLDYENHSIDANAIDDVSEMISAEFESLLNIMYRD